MSDQNLYKVEAAAWWVASPAELVAAVRRLATCLRCEGKGVDKPEDCICMVFSDTGGFRIADLTCPVHGVDGVTAQPDAPWDPCPDCAGSSLAGIEAAAKAMAEVDHGPLTDKEWRRVVGAEGVRDYMAKAVAAINAWLTEVGGQE